MDDRGHRHLPGDYLVFHKKKVSYGERVRVRDKVIHGYFAINYEIVGNVIQNKLPKPGPEIKSLCDAMGPDVD